jgi:hypothetical protein
MKPENQDRQAIQKARGIDNPLPRLLTLKQASAYLGLTVWAVRERIWAGQLPVIQWPGGRKMFLDVKDLETFIIRNKRTFD